MENTTKERIEKMIPLLNEKSLRQYLALEAKGIGHGGISEISKLTGISRTTITLGSKETEQIVENIDTCGIRKKGGGRKKVVERHANIKAELEKLLDSDGCR